MTRHGNRRPPCSTSLAFGTIRARCSPRQVRSVHGPDDRLVVALRATNPMVPGGQHRLRGARDEGRGIPEDSSLIPRPALRLADPSPTAGVNTRRSPPHDRTGPDRAGGRERWPQGPASPERPSALADVSSLSHPMPRRVATGHPRSVPARRGRGSFGSWITIGRQRVSRNPPARSGGPRLRGSCGRGQDGLR